MHIDTVFSKRARSLTARARVCVLAQLPLVFVVVGALDIVGASLRVSSYQGRIALRECVGTHLVAVLHPGGRGLGCGAVQDAPRRRRHTCQGMCA